VGLPYEVVDTRDPRKGPRGELPFIEDGGMRIADTSLIIDHLVKTRGVDPDERLDVAQGVALLSAAELHVPARGDARDEAARALPTQEGSRPVRSLVRTHGAIRFRGTHHRVLRTLREGGRRVSRAMFEENLTHKLADSAFQADMTPLLGPEWSGGSTKLARS